MLGVFARARGCQDDPFFGDVAGDAAYPERAHGVGRFFEGIGFWRVTASAERQRLDGEGFLVGGVDVGALVVGAAPFLGLVVVARFAHRIFAHGSLEASATRAGHWHLGVGVHECIRGSRSSGGARRQRRRIRWRGRVAAGGDVVAEASRER